MFLLFVAVASHAQTHGEQAAAKPSVAADDYSPDKWKTFEYPDEGFKIRLPAKPTEKVTPPQSNVVLSSKQYDLQRSYSVTIVSSRFSMDLESPDLAKTVLDGGRNGALSQIKDKDPKITRDRDITVQGHPGKFLEIETNLDLVVRTMFLVAGDRLYVIAVGTGKGKPGEMSDADYQKLVLAIFSSFQMSN